MEQIELINLLLDIVLVLLGLYFAFAAMEMRKAKGSFGTGFMMFCWALVLMGIVHMIETGLFISGTVSVEWNEFIHRVIVIVSFIILIYGFMVFKKDIFIPK